MSMFGNMKSFCNLQNAITICREVEAGCSKFGCHVALTGGTLYKDGDRKDLDILFYRIRQVKEIDYDGLFSFLISIGFKKPEGFGWIFKSNFGGIPIDIFFPEEKLGEVYGEGLPTSEVARPECVNYYQESLGYNKAIADMKHFLIIEARVSPSVALTNFIKQMEHNSNNLDSRL
jgi:hypothetical protein